MKILAIDFSSSQRSVAAATGGLVKEVLETSIRTTNLLGMIEEALRGAGFSREEVECVAIGLGPGSYTGIRAALALAQGWQLARAVKLAGISSADVIAAQAKSDGLSGTLNVVIDAQRGEFYLGTYDLTGETAREMTPLRIVSMEEMRQREGSGERLIGPEVTRWFPEGRMIFPSATTLARLALQRMIFVPGEKLEPIYLRETTFVKAPPSRVIH